MNWTARGAQASILIESIKLPALGALCHNRCDTETRMTPLLDAAEAAALLGITRQTLYSYVSRGLLHPVPAETGRGKRYRRQEVERLAARAARSRRPRAEAGATLDFGLPVLSSGLCLIAEGELWYRGQSATALAATASLEDVARLLWAADEDCFAATLPTLPASWATLCASAPELSPFDAATMRFALAVTALPALPREAPLPAQHARCACLLRLMAAALLARPPTREALHRQCARAWSVAADEAERLRAALVLCADHELNASSFTARCVASTGAPLHAAVLAGLAALSGARHGGMTERVETLLAQIDGGAAVAQAVEAALTSGRNPPGFGHPLYPGDDPRARALLHGLTLDPAAAALQANAVALGCEAPSLDFALVALRRALGLPRGAAACLFALGRSVGWLAHALEQRASGGLIRPRAQYNGIRPPPPAESSPTPQGRIVRMRR